MFTLIAFSIMIIMFVIIYYFINTCMTEKYSANNNIPVIIISYNMLTYVRDTVNQLRKYTDNIIIVDNNSSYPPLLEYLQTLETEGVIKVFRMSENHGHMVYLHEDVQKLINGDKYIITDPDLLFNPNLPVNFIDILSEISDNYNAYKVGFALSLDNLRDGMEYKSIPLPIWESRFWENPLKNDNYELYDAEIDTTFCLINKANLHNIHIRVAGNFTAIHRPWHEGYQRDFLPDELEYYQKGNISTNYNTAY